MYISIYSQEIDYKKVDKISSILCNCLDVNESKSDRIRIDECTYVLLNGLSAIQNESLREVYAKKSDTYLQRNCLEYAKLIYRNVPNSNLHLISESDFKKIKVKSIDSFESIIGDYNYQDFIGDVFNVSITKFYWIEKISSTGNFVRFLIDSKNHSLVDYLINMVQFY